MINRQTFDQAVPLAQKLAEEGVNLIPLQGSPLADIVSTCSTYGLHVEGRNLDDLQVGDVTQFLTEEACRKTAEGYNEHNDATAAVVEVASRAVQQSLSFARNVVLPDVKAMLAKVEETIKGILAARSAPYEIVANGTPDLFRNALLHELVERFHNTTAQSVERREMAQIPSTEVRAAIVTGAAQFDAEVDAILGANDGLGYRLAQEVLEGKTDLDRLNNHMAVGVHLLCKSLYDNPYEGVKMNLVDYNNRLARLIEQSGRMVYQEIERSVRRKKLGHLYDGGGVRVEGKYFIHVNNDVYLDMLAKGLTPEALIGNEFLGRRYNDSQLVEHVEELTLVYTREMRMRTMQAQMEELNLSREAIERLFSLEIVEREDEQLPVDRAALQQRLRMRLSLLRDGDLSNLTRLVRDLVCHVFYAHTDAQRILTMIDGIGEQYPEIDPREAALLATIEYVTYWVSKQIVRG